MPDFNSDVNFASMTTLSGMGPLTDTRRNGVKTLPIPDRSAILEFLARRHGEWTEHNLLWRRLLDSYEGGQRYREAIYGYDRRGLAVRNLIRHKREYPDPRETPGLGARYGSTAYLAGMANGLAGASIGIGLSQDPATFATDDDYEFRRARTPIPEFVSEAVHNYTSKIYASEIKRDVPESGGFADLLTFWQDIDGEGTSVDEWFEETVSPLLLVLGCLDICIDHPRPPVGQERPKSEADVKRLGLDMLVAGYILPNNMLWWTRDARGNYTECLVREYAPGDEEVEGTGAGPGATAIMTRQWYRHWTKEGTTLYDGQGRVWDQTEYDFGFVPIKRIFDKRKPRCRNVGDSRMEGIAAQMREYYNRDSELILSDTLQAHPLLQGPEDFINDDGTIPIGPSWLIPKKKHSLGGTVTYEGFDVVDFPKDGAESIRKNKADIRNEVDRLTGQMKPPGSAESTGTTVAQSGVSKAFDHEKLQSTLTDLSRVYAKAERAVACLFMRCKGKGVETETFADQLKITYPTVFSLYTGDELTKLVGDFQVLLADSGTAPETELEMLDAVMRKTIPGRDDDTYDRLTKEIESVINDKAKQKEQAAEGLMGGLGEVVVGRDSIQQAAEGVAKAQQQGGAKSPPAPTANQPMPAKGTPPKAS